MSAITTHVLDTATGQPAEGIEVRLEMTEPGGVSRLLGQGRTDADGRVRDLLPADHVFEAGFYSLRFEVGSRSPFFPHVLVRFRVTDVSRHYHVPLLISPFGYTTYRGS